MSSYDSPLRAPSTGAARRGLTGAVTGASGSTSTGEFGSPGVAHAHGHAQRQLGSIGGRTGPGYSPYARRVASRAAQFDPRPASAASSQSPEASAREDSADESPKQSAGLFGRVRSLPGRVLGLLSRSSSKPSGLTASASLADVRAELDQVRRSEGGGGTAEGGAGGLSRSKTSGNLMRQAVQNRAGPQSANQPQMPLQAGGMPSSSSMSALSSLASGGDRPPSSRLRSAHSQLKLPDAFAGRDRAASPSALSTTSYSQHSYRRNRSPSPLRNGLAGSMSSFQLQQQQHQPPSPPTLGDGVTSNPFGLQSQSPFAASRTYGGTARSTRSLASGAASAQGHPLFPYTSNLPRGTSPALSGSFSMRDGLSAASATGGKRTYTARAASPLAQTGLAVSKTVSGGLSSLAAPAPGSEDVEMDAGNGAERARKKQLVWDPARGLVSREKLEEEKAK